MQYIRSPRGRRRIVRSPSHSPWQADCRGVETDAGMPNPILLDAGDWRSPSHTSTRGVAHGRETRDFFFSMIPAPATQEVLAGLVERVTFHNPENGFCVLEAKARGHRDLVTVVGHAATISAGEWITASGDYTASSSGRCFSTRRRRVRSRASKSISARE